MCLLEGCLFGGCACVGGVSLTMGEGFETFEGNLELVLFGELGGVVQDRDVHEGDDGHFGSGLRRVVVSRCCFCVLSCNTVYAGFR